MNFKHRRHLFQCIIVSCFTEKYEYTKGGNRTL
jgi:hypothetical protein